ncbi:hypothetical protein D3C81_1893930 [compost metagenome]
MPEQALVEEFRRVEAMQDRQALGHHRAQIFKLFGSEGVLPAVEQQRSGHVEPLQGLGNGA